jgi:hypothetical protein
MQTVGSSDSFHYSLVHAMAQENHTSQNSSVRELPIWAEESGTITNREAILLHITTSIPAQGSTLIAGLCYPEFFPLSKTT